jgi:hypothetical protein
VLSTKRKEFEVEEKTEFITYDFGRNGKKQAGDVAVQGKKYKRI